MILYCIFTGTNALYLSIKPNQNSKNNVNHSKLKVGAHTDTNIQRNTKTLGKDVLHTRTQFLRIFKEFITNFSHVFYMNLKRNTFLNGRFMH